MNSRAEVSKIVDNNDFAIPSVLPGEELVLGRLKAAKNDDAGIPFEYWDNEV